MYEKEGELGVETVHAEFAAFWTQGWRSISRAFLAAANHSIAIKRYYPYHLSWWFFASTPRFCSISKASGALRLR